MSMRLGPQSNWDEEILHVHVLLLRAGLLLGLLLIVGICLSILLLS